MNMEMFSLYWVLVASGFVLIAAEIFIPGGILGVIDGSPPLGIEGEEDIEWRKGFLRMIGYKA